MGKDVLDGEDDATGMDLMKTINAVQKTFLRGFEEDYS